MYVRTYVHVRTYNAHCLLVGVKLRGMLVRVDEKVERKKTKRRKVEDEVCICTYTYVQCMYMHACVL